MNTSIILVISKDIQVSQTLIEMEILRTPTGPDREKLTGVNIHLMAAIGILAALLSGCMTCQKYPVPCMVASAIVVGSIAATVEANMKDHNNAITTVRKSIKCDALCIAGINE